MAISCGGEEGKELLSNDGFSIEEGLYSGGRTQERKDVIG